MRMVRAVAVAAMGILLGAAPLMATAAHAASEGVSIQNFSFMPSQLTVRVGDTVTWTNNDSPNYHTVSGAAFDSSPACMTMTGVGCLQPGQHFSHTFSTAGSFDYHCNVHSSMTGTVVVEAPAPATTAPAITAPTTVPHAPTTAAVAPTAPHATTVAAPAITATTHPAATTSAAPATTGATGAASSTAPSGTIQVSAPIRHTGSGSAALGIGLGVTALVATTGAVITVVRRRRS
jgi:plastocyanin